MDKINFQNGITPLNDTNLNQMQDNMEKAIENKQISFNEIANNPIKHFNIQTDGSSGWYSILKLSDADWSSALVKIDVTNYEGRLQSVLLYAGIVVGGDTGYRRTLDKIGGALGYSGYSTIFSAARISIGEGKCYLDINLQEALNFDIHITVIDGIGEWTITGGANKSASSNTSVIEITL